MVRELGQTERDLADALRPHPPLRGPLRVAIAGRTKAGKTTLRKALTHDPDPHGVGRGAHRTTRKAEAFAWRALEFVDTPGIAAYDDDYDAETALAACRDADAVLWVYAEDLRSEELDHLCGLLALGKPVLVVVNAKWRVDTPNGSTCSSVTPTSPSGTSTATPNASPKSPPSPALRRQPCCPPTSEPPSRRYARPTRRSANKHSRPVESTTSRKPCTGSSCCKPTRSAQRRSPKPCERPWRSQQNSPSTRSTPCRATSPQPAPR